MTKDRSRNRPGRGPSNTGFKPPGRGADGPRGRGPAGPADPDARGDSDKPWEKRRPAPAAQAGVRAPEDRREGKSWGKPGSGPAKAGRSGPGGFGGKPRPDRPKWSAERGPKPAAASPQPAAKRPDRFAKPARPGGDREVFKPNDSFAAPEDDDALAFDAIAEDGDDEAPWEARAPAGRDRNDRRPGARPRFERREAAFEEGGDVWIWGLHAVGAALANPKRRIREALLTRNAAQRLGLDPEAPPAFVKLLDPKEIDHRLPEGAVHQGAGVRAAPLDALDISDVVTAPDRPLVILDQLTDPQNVGAVFRSAAAFGFGGVVMQTRRAPALGGALAKAAAGGVEATPEVRAVNLARAIDALTDAGWLVVGLDGEAAMTLAEAYEGDEPLAIVLGAEGSGLRPAVAKACSRLARIPMPGDMESLNVSNAAAIAFYEASRRRR